jgi:hypothetical protein
MHQELIDELLAFAREHNLRFDYNFDGELKKYFFKFQNQEMTWGYAREISQEILDTFNGPSVYFAYEFINELKRKLPIY